MTLRAGVVGLGHIAKAHHIPGYNTHSHVDLAAICDIDSTTLNEVGNKNNIPGRYENINNMIKHAEVDILSICTPPSNHKKMINHAVQNNIDILCEKPITTSISDLNEIVESIKKHNIIAAGGYALQFESTFERAINQIQHNLIGPPRRLEIMYYGNFPQHKWMLDPNKSGGGALLDLFPHIMSYILRFLDKEPELIKARTKRYAAENIESDVKMSIRVGETEITIQTGWRNYGGPQRIDVFGEEGVISVQSDMLEINTYGTHSRFNQEGLPSFDLNNIFHRYPTYVGKSSGIKRIHSFIDSVLMRSNPKAPLTDSKTILPIIKNAYEQMDIKTPLTES